MHLIYQFSPLKDLITKIYNTALAAGSFPSSWQDLRVRLLPKKGDLSTLKNWRPISLINCDAKIYTRIINQRMRSVLDTIINRYQTGFLGDRFIAENGMILNILMEQAHVQKRPEIGLLLDQEKAYDRVHPMYLRQTMLAFGFPPSLVHSLESLFFGNAVRININGYFANRIDQRRGLRQGDPLSPFLFNIALEPFLRHILQDSSFQGFRFQFVSNSATTTSNTMPPPLKVLAYADDVCVLLHSTDDYCRLRHHLDRYGSVSNAKVNIHKTEAFSLDGRSYPEWIAFLAVQGISKWHDHSSPSPLRYLGFPLIQSSHQRRYLEQQLLQTVKSQCTIYSQRRLSIKGRVTIINIRRFHSGNTGTRLALFSPLLRLRPAVHANNFMQNIYEAVDCFGYADTEQAKCTPATLLRLPLSAIFAMIPTDYWITRSRHKKLKVSQFFTYDHHFGCIRPLLSSDQPSSPRLVSKLSQDIHNHIIKLNQLIWPHILNQNQPLGEVDDSAFIDAFCLQPHWINYKPKPFRLSLIQRSLPSSALSQIPTSKWSLFWTMPVSPESRSLWYRLLHRKLYSQSLLSRFDNNLTSSQCKFCSANTEDLQHLFVRCPMKWRQFIFVDNIDLWTLSCCVLSVIWRAHWRFTIDGFPFIDKQLVTRAMSQFASLTRGRLDLD
ncbi:hypothetical protein G6F40_003152 [Rhizopus arrhizus]|nr:hypothetical protein G6F40_003152 [Rhizopus arrhizus]